MTLQERFDNKWMPEPNSGCWLWLGAYHRQGYGNITVDSRSQLAHRVSWFLHHGFMPDPKIKVCHRCDLPSCVNPDHLFLGSQLDNMRDCFSKGRGTRADHKGEKNVNAILSEEQVLSILDDHRKYREIAAVFGCSPSTIGMIKKGRNWPHVYEQWLQSHEANNRLEAKL